MESEFKTEQQKEDDAIREKLVRDFSFESGGFSNPIPWSGDIGLSRVKKYQDGYASLFKIGLFGEAPPPAKKRLWVTISYGKEAMGGISLGDEGRKISSPVDLDFRDEFCYDTESGKYFHKEKEISASELFKVVEEAHMRPLKALRGFWVRRRLWFWRKLLPGLVKWLDIFLVKLLWLISGEKIKDDIIGRLVGVHHEKIKDPIPPGPEFEESKKMDFFGYKAKRWSVVFYCAIHLIGFYFFFHYGIHPRFFPKIFQDNFLALCYVVVSFAITEALMPRTLRWLIIKITPVAFGEISFKRLEI